MKVVKNDSNQTLTQAEMEACRQFKRSQRAGQALFRPLMDTSQPAPSWVAFLEGTGRFAVTILEGRHRVQGGRWWRHDENGVQTPIDNPLEQAWQAARAVRTQINRELELNTYVLSVVWFPDMEEDEDILDEAYGRSVHLCFGEVDLAQRLVQLPSEDQLQTHLSRRYIQREVAALSRSRCCGEGNRSGAGNRAGDGGPGDQRRASGGTARGRGQRLRQRRWRRRLVAVGSVGRNARRPACIPAADGSHRRGCDGARARRESSDDSCNCCTAWPWPGRRGSHLTAPSPPS